MTRGRGPAGHTSRWRLCAVLLPVMGVAGLMLHGVAEGVIPTALASVAPMTVHVAHLESTGLGIELVVPQQNSAGLAARLPTAQLTGLCQSSTTTLPAVGAVTTVLRAEHVHATDLVIDVRNFEGNLDLTQLLIGPAEHGFGYRAGPVKIDHLAIDSGSVAAGTFTISGLELSYHFGAGGC